MERKIVFLDIDGVLQPIDSQKRFDHCHGDIKKSPMLAIYKSLEEKFGIDYSVYKQWDVAAVLFDWDKVAVSLLKLILNLTDSKIVVSSDWRLGGFKLMKDFFTLHGLENYFIDITSSEESFFAEKMGLPQIDSEFSAEIEAKHKREYGEQAYLHWRTIEIFDWLHRNPDVKKWVAIDDMDLDGIGPNFVRTDESLNEIDAEKCIRILHICEKNHS